MLEINSKFTVLCKSVRSFILFFSTEIVLSFFPKEDEIPFT